MVAKLPAGQSSSDRKVRAPSIIFKLAALLGLLLVFIWTDPVAISKAPEIEVLVRMITAFCSLILCLPSRDTFNPPMLMKTYKPFRIVFQFLGDKSYSIYLVHWPLISIGLWAQVSLHQHQILFFGIIIGLSWASWYFFERSTSLTKKLKPALLLSFIAVGSAFMAFDNHLSTENIREALRKTPGRLDQEWTEAQLDATTELQLAPCGEPLQSRWPGATCKIFAPDEQKKSPRPVLYLVGDSHAQHLLWGAVKYAQEKAYNLAYLSSRFPFAAVNTQFDRCATFRNWAVQWKRRLLHQSLQPRSLQQLSSLVQANDLLVFSDYSQRYLQLNDRSTTFPLDIESNEILSSPEVRQRAELQFSEFLNSIPKSTKVLLVLDTLVLADSPEFCLQDQRKCQISVTALDDQRTKTKSLYDVFAFQYQNVRVVDMAPDLCQLHNCTLRNETGQLLYRDTDHLSPIDGQLFYKTLMRWSDFN